MEQIPKSRKRMENGLPARNVVYLLRCADGTLYSGWTNDITKRMASHNFGTCGAKYTKSRRPVTLVYCERWETRGEAMRQEALQKKLTHLKKEALAQSCIETGEECLAVYDSKMQPCGILPRKMVHGCGLRHRVVHVIVYEIRDGVSGIWMQQRGLDRPLLPGAYDWTATGHVDPGESVREAAARELCEESRLAVPPEKLQEVDEIRYQCVWGDDFFDDENATVFVYKSQEFLPFAAGTEVSNMAWVSEKELTNAFQKQTPMHMLLLDGTKRMVEAKEIGCFGSEWDIVQQKLNKV